MLSTLTKTAGVRTASPAIGVPPPGADWTASFTPGRLAVAESRFSYLRSIPKSFSDRIPSFDRDFGLFTYPVAHYAREQILSGHVPLWNPLSDCGVPFLGQ